MRTIKVEDLKNRIFRNDFICSGISCNGALEGLPKCIFNCKMETSDWGGSCGSHTGDIDFSAIKEHDFGRIKNISIKTLKKFLIKHKVEDYETN